MVLIQVKAMSNESIQQLKTEVVTLQQKIAEYEREPTAKPVGVSITMMVNLLMAKLTEVHQLEFSEYLKQQEVISDPSGKE